MRVLVRLYATLRDHHPGLAIGQALAVDLPARATVRDLLAQLGVPADEVRLVFVNGVFRDLEHPLVEGDEVGAFPPVGGG